MSTLRSLLPFLVMASSPLLPSSFPQIDISLKKDILSSTILSSLEKMVIFLEESKLDINVNDIMCFRILQVELKGVQKTWATDPQMQSLTQHVQSLLQRLEFFIDKSMDKLPLIQSSGLTAFLPITKPEFWKLPSVWTDTNTSMVYPEVQYDDSKVKTIRRECMVKLLKQRTSENQTCSYSDDCKSLVTTPGGTHYYLFHQQLFFVFSRMLGCTEDLFNQTQYYMDLFCANMMKMNQDAEYYEYTFPDHALFMRNILFCGFAGFIDFYKPQWLQKILSWPIPGAGCFGNSYGCTVYDTSAALGAMGGFLYVLATQPTEYEKQLQIASSMQS